MKPKITIGLVGPISAGMWVVTESLRERGFAFYSLSDRVREKATGLPPTRETWRQVGERWRDEEDRGLRGESGQNIEASLSIADKVFENTGDLDKLRARVQSELIPWLEMSRTKKFAERV